MLVAESWSRQAISHSSSHSSLRLPITSNLNDRLQQCLDARAKRASELREFGWHELEDAECDSIWDRFKVFFGCNDDRFDVPAPSSSWDVRHVIQLPEESVGRKKNVQDLQRHYIRVIRECQLPGERWFALDFNHPCYRLAVERIDDTLESWPVEALPDIDEGYFVSEDFSAGIITTLRSSVCLYGERLIQSMEQSLPLAFTKPNGHCRVEPVDDNK
ncbi:MAG: hypothetical protein ACI93T_004437 [Porticoccaceae bacterium]|jgi:hypothetical protein